MKKTFKFMVVAAVLAFAANSSLMAQFKFGVKASGTLNNIYTEDSTTTSMKPGFNVGIMGEYFLNDNMSVGAELLFAQQGCQEKDEGEDLGVKWSSKTAITTNHINLTIMFRYYFGGLAVELGPQFGFCLGGKFTSTYEAGDNKEENTTKFSEVEEDVRKVFSDYKYYNRLQIGGAIGLTYNMPMGLFLGARYTYDFTDMFNKVGMDGTNPKNEAVKSKNGVISVSVGYKF